ncbi:MAG: hypothetical protein KAS32_21405 [Candidatus Peribacteraceae bacterium]|nr:hypothetical protein [Candidatus Peribacteraceae bacterium]
MKHKKIIKRGNGKQFQINVRVYEFMECFHYGINVVTREKGKRKWNDIPRQIPEWNWRRLSMEDRRRSDDKNTLRFVSLEEIHAAKIEAWESLKPKPTKED